MTTYNNPRSAQYKQAYAWMTPSQRAHAYLVYKQEQLRHWQNVYATAVNEWYDTEPINHTPRQAQMIDRLDRKVHKLEEQVAHLEQAEYRKAMREQEQNDRQQKRFEKWFETHTGSKP